MRQKNIGPSECDFAGTDLKKTNRTNNPDHSISDTDPAAAPLHLASQGWAPFPCKWHGDDAKRPLTRNGFHDATTDPDQIRQWWTRWPRAMIGCPVPVGLLVLDLDPYHGGTLEALEAVTGPLPATVTTWSGRNDGGRHLFYRVNPKVEPVATRLPKGVDLRAGGKAYTIVAPSLHPLTGQAYRWEGSQFAVLPVQALRALLPPPIPPRTHKPTTGGNGAGLVRTVAEAVEGNRNASLFWSARAAAADGILDQLETDLIGAARTVGLSETEARRTIASARRAVTA